MRLVSATLYALRIPFVGTFTHSFGRRRSCDSVVVRVVADDGTEGYGEGVPRPYVTGETTELMIEHLARRLWPALAGNELPELGQAGLDAVGALVPDLPAPVTVAPHASRAALELAVLDCCLRQQDIALGTVLPPRRRQVVYSGVIGTGPLPDCARQAERARLAGLGDVKVKVGRGDDVPRVRAVRDVLGPQASIRLDANGAWDFDEALRVMREVAPLGVTAVEQPLPRRSVAELRRLKDASPLRVMADESLVTPGDADALFAAGAVDCVNVRISKCGGLHRSVDIARRAVDAGVCVHVGSHVGETAILAAAGRHLSASLEHVGSSEGSFGTLLLVEDLADGVRFGHRGHAPVLAGPGLGVEVDRRCLERYSEQVVELSPVPTR